MANDFWHPRLIPLELFATFRGLSGHVGHGRRDTRGWNRGFFCHPLAREAFMADPNAWGRQSWQLKLEEVSA